MSRAKVLSAFFPTTTMMVDDSEAFLSNLCLMLDRTKRYELMTTPLESLEKVRQSFNPRGLFENLNRDSNFDLDECASNEETVFSVLKSLAENDTRHETISVIVIDFSMPEMDGLEFCRKLREHPAKKIMLTGEADLDTAVEAFNEGIIDRFFVKGTENLFSKIDAAISDLQMKFFEEFCQEVSSKLEQFYCLHFLSDPKYKLLFDGVSLKKKPLEYYLVDETGSFMFVDCGGERSWLAINTEKDLKKYSDIANDNDASEKVCHLIKSKKAVLFSPKGEHKGLPVSSWEKFMYPSKTMPGSQYFYSLVKQ